MKTTTESDGTAIMRVLTERISKELEREALDAAVAAIRPKVKEVVAGIVKELEPVIRSRADHFSHEMVLELSFREPKP